MMRYKPIEGDRIILGSFKKALGKVLMRKGHLSKHLKLVLNIVVGSSGLGGKIKEKLLTFILISPHNRLARKSTWVFA